MVFKYSEMHDFMQREKTHQGKQINIYITQKMLIDCLLPELFLVELG
jgi:hypothetical protein